MKNDWIYLLCKIIRWGVAMLLILIIVTPAIYSLSVNYSEHFINA